MTASEPRPARLPDLVGPVVRTLLVTADGTRDATTAVTWLQGLTYYVDLRRPAGRPLVIDAADDVTLVWARAHEGFAGRCEQTPDGVTHWHRAVDVRPAGEHPDAGRLVWRGHEVIEDGVHAAYVEHWHPEPVAAGAAVAGALLRGTDDHRPAVLVRVADRFGWACGRGADDDPGDPLTALVALGRVTARGWVVETASLPWLEGADLAPARDGDRLRAGVGPVPARWDVIDAEARPGDPFDLLTEALDPITGGTR